jgi:hypothetical protein
MSRDGGDTQLCWPNVPFHALMWIRFVARRRKLRLDGWHVVSRCVTARKGITMKRVRYLSGVLALAIPIFCVAQSSHEREVWALENSYWQYVKSNDLDRYRTLWHRDFLGWPYSDTEPAGKERITVWIEAHTGKGETLSRFN